MSRQYQFDEQGLRDILELAYRHGFSEGYGYADWCVKHPPSKAAQDMAREEINWSSTWMDIGSIIAGDEPLLPSAVRPVR